MKLAAAIVKSLKENLRDWKVLAMVLVFSPFFLLVMFVLYGSESTTYKVGIVDFDGGNPAAEMIEAIKGIEGQDGEEMFLITTIVDVDELKALVKDKTLDIGVVIPDKYSQKHREAESATGNDPAIVDFYGSMSNVRYTVAAVMTADALVNKGMEAMGITLPAAVSETFLEKNLPMNEFDSYAPGLITLAILMILFTASASIVKENDKKTLIRLKLSRLGAFNFLTGTCIVQTIIGTAALVLAYFTALGLGYRPAGSFGIILLVGIISSLAMVSISLVVASFLKTVFDVLTAGCFPFFILMFFSGAMFPLPKMELVTIGGHSLGVTDILPLTHTVNAFNKILNYGAGWKDILFDMVLLVLLTAAFFWAGLVLYQKRRLSKA